MCLPLASMRDMKAETLAKEARSSASTEILADLECHASESSPMHQSSALKHHHNQPSAQMPSWP